MHESQRTSAAYTERVYGQRARPPREPPGEQTNGTTVPRNVRRSTVSRVSKWMTGTCERRLPPPRRAAPRAANTNERRPTPTAAAGHTDASMRTYGRAHQCAGTQQLRSVSLPPQAVLPPLVASPASQGRRPTGAKENFARPSPEFVGYEEENLCNLSLSLRVHFYPTAIKKIQSTTRSRYLRQTLPSLPSRCRSRISIAIFRNMRYKRS